MDSTRELYCLGKLKHDNIVTYFCKCELASNPGMTGIVMELCQGSLDDLFGAKLLKLPEVSRIFKQVIGGVAYLHSKDVIHRYCRM